jgi:hypothetical protein
VVELEAENLSTGLLTGELKKRSRANLRRTPPTRCFTAASAARCVSVSGTAGYGRCFGGSHHCYLVVARPWAFLAFEEPG